jgi:creatinine amidohydrolase
MSLVPEQSPITSPPYDILPPAPDLTPPSGCLLSAAKASAAKGKLLLECVVSGIVAALIERTKQKPREQAARD